MDNSHLPSRPCSSSQPHNPMPFGSSSLTTPSLFSSSPTSSYLLNSESSFNRNNQPTLSSFTSSPSSTPFYDNVQSQQTPSPSSSGFRAPQQPTPSPHHINQSPSISPYNSSNHSKNNSPSPHHNVKTPRSTSPTKRIKSWKGRDNGRTSYNQGKARRDEVVSRFRGIDLSRDEDNQYDDSQIDDDADDFYSSLVDPGANDPAWSWDSMCNKEIKSIEPNKEIPWYILDPNCSWEDFLHHVAQDRAAKGANQQSNMITNDQMGDQDDDDDRIDDKEIDPWAETISEIRIDQLINENDPYTMICPYCKQYAFQKVSQTRLECSHCGHNHNIMPTTTVSMLKHRMLESLHTHRSNCLRHFSNYTLSEGNIVLICANCDSTFNISRDL